MPPPTVVVRVVYVSPQGAVVPAADEEVSVERWAHSPGPMGGGPQLVEVWSGRTDTTGRVGFTGPPPARGERLEAAVIRNGLTFRSAPLEKLQPGLPLDVRLYEITDSIEGLKADYQVELQVRDGFLLVRGHLYVDNDSRQVVVPAAGEPGLRFPVPLPAVFGDSLDQGLLPPEPAGRHISSSSTPEHGRMVFREGALWYDGPVFPGVRQTLQMACHLAITDERMDLAFRSGIPLNSLIISSRWSDRVAPQVVPDRSFRVREGRRGETINRVIRVDDLPEPGTAVVLRIDHLHRPLGVQVFVAIVGSLLLLAAFVLAVISGRRGHV